MNLNAPILVSKLQQEGINLDFSSIYSDGGVKIFRPADIQQIFTTEFLGQQSIGILLKGAKEPIIRICDGRDSEGTEPSFELQEKRFFGNRMPNDEEGEALEYTKFEFVDPSDQEQTYRLYGGILSWRKVPPKESGIREKFWIVRLSAVRNIYIMPLTDTLYQLDLVFNESGYALVVNESFMIAVLRHFERAS